MSAITRRKALITEAARHGLVLVPANAPVRTRTAAKPVVVAVTSSRPVNAKRDAHQATRKPSIGQMELCNALEALLGNRECATLAQFRRIFPTMLDASVHYYSLKDECKTEGLI